MEILIKLKNLDRRYVFLFVALAVCLPMLFEISLPVTPGKTVTGLKEFLDTLPTNTVCFLSYDYDMASKPELQPAAIAILVHMFRQGLRPACGGNWPLGGDMAEGALATAHEIFTSSYNDAKAKGLIREGVENELVYGKHYVNLGYKPGAIIHVKAMTSDFFNPYPADRAGNQTIPMPIFQTSDSGRFSIKDIGIIISFTAGTAGIESFISVAGEHQRPMAAGCTSVNIPRFYTYMQTNQLIGLTGGLPGAAEYESLIDYVGQARRGVVSQSVAHLVIMAFIILGNIAFIVETANAKKKH